MNPTHPLRVLRRNRQPIAALLTGAAVFLGIRATTHPPDTAPVVVTTRAVAAGARLSQADLQVREYPRELVPVGSESDPAPLLGEVSAVAMGSGEMVNEARLLGTQLSADPADPARAPMPIRLSDAAAATLLRPGNRIDVLAAPLPTDDASTRRARVIARNVLVLAVTGQSTAATGLFGASSSASDEGALILVSASPAQAELLAGAQERYLTFVVR